MQKRLNANKHFAGGVATAKVPYLLTGKLFCGHCGTDMVSDGGTSKLGAQHHYYTCKKKKKSLCDKHREIKDKLELYVVSCVRDFLSNKKNAEIAVDDVLNYYNKRTDENSLKSITTKIANAKVEIDKLTDAFVNANSVLLRNTIERKMNDYEVLLNDLYAQQAKLELERGCKITKKDLMSFIEVLLNGDINDKEYQKKVIDFLVTQVFVYDSHTVVYLNIKGEKNIESINLEDANAALKGVVSIQTQTPFARQSKPKSNI